MNLANLISIIDSQADAIVRDVVGERTEEYRVAESEATAYRDGGYIGEVPASVKAWSDAKGWTGSQAAEDILATAVQWRGAQAQIRTARLAHKELARAATDDDGRAAVLASYMQAVRAIRAALGVA